MKRTFALMTAVTIGIGAGATSDHPNSAQQPLQDGCNRSQLILLGEAAVDLVHKATMEVAPEWVYVSSGSDVRTIRTLEGRVLASHTAGQDLFGSHTSYDLNIDVAPYAKYANLLSTRNAEEKPAQIHTEWEAANVPTWAWPSPGDRVRETGSWVWDCGHWQEGARKIPDSDYVPGDPLAAVGVESVGGEEAEIHPISELATWRTLRAFVPSGGHTAVPVNHLDVYISNRGGGAKAVEECALSPSDPGAAPKRIAADAGCSELQDVTGRDYTYVLRAPPRPGPGAKLHWLQIPRASHSAPRATVRTSADRITVRVPFTKVKSSARLQDFGASYLAWWSKDAVPTRRFRVSLVRFDIFNNLDADAGSEQANPEVALVSPNGEWNAYLDVAGQWVTLHQDIKRAGIGDLDNVGRATRTRPQTYALSRLRPVEADVVADGTFRMFVDARECDLPGFTDCPADKELDFAQHPGRSEIVIPVSKLIGTTTTFTVHAPTCRPNGPCPEELSDPVCHGPCYDLVFTVTDLAAKSPRVHTVAGDGTRTGTTYDAKTSRALAWWLNPLTQPSLDQNEEAGFIRRAVENLLER